MDELFEYIKTVAKQYNFTPDEIKYAVEVGITATLEVRRMKKRFEREDKKA